MLKEGSAAGSFVLNVDSTTGFHIGRTVIIDLGTDDQEVGRIASFGSIILMSPLKYDHNPGAVVRQQDVEGGP